MEGSDLGTAGHPFEPTARWINDTRKRQLVSRFGLPRLRCCVCHLHHKWAMNSPAAVREFCKQCFNKCITSRLMSLQEMPTLQHTSTTKSKSTKICTIPWLQSCQEKCNVRSIRDTQFERRLHIDYSTNNHQTQLHAANDIDCCFMAILSW